MPRGDRGMKATLVVEFESAMKELVGILVKNGYKVVVEKTGYYYEDKYRIEVSKGEIGTSNK